MPSNTALTVATPEEIRAWQQALFETAPAAENPDARAETDRSTRDVRAGVHAYIMDAVMAHGGRTNTARRIADNLCGSLPRVVNAALMRERDALAERAARAEEALAMAELTDAGQDLADLRQELERVIDHNVALATHIEHCPTGGQGDLTEAYRLPTTADGERWHRSLKSA